LHVFLAQEDAFVKSVGLTDPGQLLHAL